MLAEAPAFLIAIEQSAFAAGIRQSVWIYPAANVGHILALLWLAASVGIMDLALLGALRSATPATLVVGARRAAMIGLLAMLATGSILFAAEASHVAMNAVFQTKLVLIGLGILNALMTGPTLRRVLADVPAAFPLRLKAAAVLSLMLWVSVAACGRLIAYF